MTENYCVYLLINTNNNRTYIGITNNLTRRLRQHNCELVGGARYTTMNKQNGIWICYGTINNLTKNLALSYERKIKNISKSSINNKKTSIEKRLNAISQVISNTDYIFTIL